MELDIDRMSWVWRPLERFGPFKFGTGFDEVPFKGEIIDSDHWNATEYALYSSSLPALELTFWNRRLAGVGVTDFFAKGGLNLIGANFQDIRHLFPGEPEIEDLTSLLFASYDDLDLQLSMDLEWTVKSVDVGVDPDVLEGAPHKLDI